MKIFLIIFCTFFSFNAFANADEDFLCNVSKACKKVCGMKRDQSYSDLDPSDQKIMVKCIEDLQKKSQSQL